MNQEARVGDMVRLIIGDGTSKEDFFGHYHDDVGKITGIDDTSIQVEVKGRTSTSGYAPSVAYHTGMYIVLTRELKIDNLLNDV